MDPRVHRHFADTVAQAIETPSGEQQQTAQLVPGIAWSFDASKLEGFAENITKELLTTGEDYNVKTFHHTMEQRFQRAPPNERYVAVHAAICVAKEVATIAMLAFGTQIDKATLAQYRKQLTRFICCFNITTATVSQCSDTAQPNVKHTATQFEATTATAVNGFGSLENRSDSSSDNSEASIAAASKKQLPKQTLRINTSTSRSGKEDANPMVQNAQVDCVLGSTTSKDTVNGAKTKSFDIKEENDNPKTKSANAKTAVQSQKSRGGSNSDNTMIASSRCTELKRKVSDNSDLVIGDSAEVHAFVRITERNDMFTNDVIIIKDEPNASSPTECSAKCNLSGSRELSIVQFREQAYSPNTTAWRNKAPTEPYVSEPSRRTADDIKQEVEDVNANLMQISNSSAAAWPVVWQQRNTLNSDKNSSFCSDVVDDSSESARVLTSATKRDDKAVIDIRDEEPEVDSKRRRRSSREDEDDVRRSQESHHRRPPRRHKSPSHMATSSLETDKRKRISPRPRDENCPTTSSGSGRRHIPVGSEIWKDERCLLVVYSVPGMNNDEDDRRCCLLVFNDVLGANIGAKEITGLRRMGKKKSQTHSRPLVVHFSTSRQRDRVLAIAKKTDYGHARLSGHVRIEPYVLETRR